MIGCYSSGDYGNRIDPSMMPSPSTTPPTHPIKDSSGTYSISWLDAKPYITIESHWEDIRFRLEAMNMLLASLRAIVSEHICKSQLY